MTERMRANEYQEPLSGTDAGGRGVSRRLSRSRFEAMSNEELATMAVSGHPQAQEIEAYLIARNDRLVHGIVRRYTQWCAMPAEDLHAEGVKGFLIGLRKFDPSKGTKLTTLVVHWIRQSVGRAAEAADMVRIPTHMADDLSRYHHRKHEVEGLSSEQVAKHFGWRQQHAEVVLQAYEVRNVHSLDTPLTDAGKSSTMGDMLASYVIGPEEIVLRGALRLQLEGAMGQLDPRTQAVLSRCVLGEDTLEDTGRELGISRERVRQIRDSGIRTLRQKVAAQCIER